MDWLINFLKTHVSYFDKAHKYKIGGPGAVVTNLTDPTQATAANPYRLDFDPERGDALIIAGIDADTADSGTQAFTITPVLQHHAGQSLLTGSGSSWTFAADRDGDGTPDFVIKLNVLGSQNTFPDVGSHIYL